MNNVQAIVVTHNNENDIVACVESLVLHGIKQITVVDSASSDDTVSVAKKLSVDCISLSQNRGFGAAVNMGAAQTKAEYLLFLNPDARVKSGSVADATEYVDANPHVAALGFLLVSSVGILEETSWGHSVSFTSLVTRRFMRGQPQPTAPRLVGWVSGGAMLVRAKDFLAAGGFDERFFLYWEDVDLCRRLTATGKAVVLYPAITIEHDRGGSLRDLGRKTRLYDESADRYFRKHYATPIWILQRLLRRLYRLYSPQVR